MEFVFDVNSLLLEEITKLAGKRTSVKLTENVKLLSVVVDAIGMASSKAQGLLHPVTTFMKLNAKEEVIYILKGNDSNDRGVVLGFLKTGRRKLFLNDSSGRQYQVVSLCLLDFYIHESRQRHGFGKKLFDAMMKEEEVKPFEVAIDRPSSKLLNFLKKHYRLHPHIKQSNHYVVFNEFFDTRKGKTRTAVIPPITFTNKTSYQPPKPMVVFPPIIPVLQVTYQSPPRHSKRGVDEKLSSDLVVSDSEKLPCIKVDGGDQETNDIRSSNATASFWTNGRENNTFEASYREANAIVRNHLKRSSIQASNATGKRRTLGSTDLGSGIFRSIFGNGIRTKVSDLKTRTLSLGSYTSKDYQTDADIAPFLNMRQKRHRAKTLDPVLSNSQTLPSLDSNQKHSKDHYSRHKVAGAKHSREPPSSDIKDQQRQNKK